MAIIAYILGTILSYWTWILLAAIAALSTKWYLSKKKDVVDPFLGVPEVKPHWFWGNNDFSKNMNIAAVEHYQRLKGLRYGIYYNMNEKRLFVLDPDICSKIMITDFDHFDYVPFWSKEYADVRFIDKFGS